MCGGSVTRAAHVPENTSEESAWCIFFFLKIFSFHFPELETGMVNPTPHPPATTSPWIFRPRVWGSCVTSVWLIFVHAMFSYTACIWITAKTTHTWRHAIGNFLLHEIHSLSGGSPELFSHTVSWLGDSLIGHSPYFFLQPLPSLPLPQAPPFLKLNIKACCFNSGERSKILQLTPSVLSMAVPWSRYILGARLRVEPYFLVNEWMNAVLTLVSL